MQLIVLEGEAAQSRYAIDRPSVIIGRAPDCDVVLRDQEASRHHASISLVGGRYVIQDVEAANPTVINGRLLKGARPLQDGDLIVIGRVLLQVIAEPEPSPSPAARPSRLEAVGEPGDSARDALQTLEPLAPTEVPKAEAPSFATEAFQTLEQSAFETVEERAEPLVGRALAGVRPVDVPRDVAHRLTTARQRLDGSATRLAALAAAGHRRPPERVRARLDALVAEHDALGGTAELQRLSGLLGKVLDNQTDFDELRELGRATPSLARAAGLGNQSLTFFRELGRVMCDEC